MSEEMFEWTCPRVGCKRQILAYTERGLRSISEMHIDQHIREDRDKLKDQNPEPKQETAIEKYKPRDYDTLRITRADANFLKTRYIAIDDKIVIEDV